MPVSEHDLRELLRERSDAVPVSAGLAQRVQLRVRRRRRFEAGGAAAALVLVLLATGLVALPRHEAVGPASTTHRSTQVLGGSLVVTTEGPTRIEDETPFDLTLEVVNTSTTPWTGTLAVGLVLDGEVPGMLGGNGVLTSAGDVGFPFGTQGPSAVSDTSDAQEFDGLAVDRVTLQPGEDRVWTMPAKRWPGGSVLGPVLGWIPYADDASRTDEFLMGGLAAAAPVSVVPVASNRACDTVSITSASVGNPGSWQITDADTAVVGDDLTARWTPVEVSDAPVTTVESDGDARDATVMAAVSAYLNDGPTPVPATGYGPEQYALETTEGAPGRYVSFSGTRMVEVSFTGVCGPSGNAISGVWNAYYRSGGGLLLCGRAPEPGSMAAVAQRYCPA
jgi:hypothetical protein